MQPSAQRDRPYVLGHSQRELERLSAQARMFEPFTRQLFHEAGLAPGMRVLDVGSGAGDVAFLAASVVGPNGSVVGLDRSATAVEAARARACEFGLDNVTFETGDAAAMSFAEPFDAVIGRLVLLYSPDPALTLKQLAGTLRPGGIIAFQEFDFRSARSYPPSPAYDRAMEWLEAVFERSGADVCMGLKLHAAFLAAGLPAPALRLDAAVGSGPNHITYLAIAETVRTVLPLIEKFGLATPAEVDIDSLRDRVEAEALDSAGVIVSPSLIGAWAQVQ